MWRYSMGLLPLPTALGGGLGEAPPAMNPLLMAHPELTTSLAVVGSPTAWAPTKAADVLGPDGGAVDSGTPMWAKGLAFVAGAAIGLAVVKFVFSR